MTPRPLSSLAVLLTSVPLNQSLQCRPFHFRSRMLAQVGDTHGQLNDFCWILRSHGPPAPGNMYLINGDVADRGK